MFKKRLFLIAFSLILLLGFFLRFYKLGEIPLGLNNDEASIGLNAYSILQIGKDEYGTAYPIYFESYGDDKMPLYIYATTFAISLFGVNEFSVRVTSALFGTVTILAVFVLTQKLLKRNAVSLIAAFLIAVNPWHIFFSRAGFEVNVATAFLTLGVLFFVLAISYKRFLYFLGVLSLGCFILSMYTYNATRVLSPVLFVSLFVFYWKELGKYKIQKVLGYLCLFFIIAFPLFIASSPDAEYENQSTLFIFAGETLGKSVEFRAFLSVLPAFISKLFFSIPALTFLAYVKNVVSFFSVDYFFIHGANHPINGTTNHGMFYLFELLTIPTGIYLVIKKKIQSLFYVCYWVVITVLLVSITKEVPHPTRMFAVVIPLTILSSYGGIYLLERIKKLPVIWARNTLFVVITCCVVFSLIYYYASYFFYFPYQFAKTWRSEDREVALFIKDNAATFDRVIIDKESNFLYASLLFYGEYDMNSVQKNAVYTKNGLLRTMEKMGKYEFVDIDEEKDKTVSNTLIVTSKNDLPGYSLLQMFYYPTKPVVMYVDGVNTKLDIQDTAYGIYKTN